MNIKNINAMTPGERAAKQEKFDKVIERVAADDAGKYDFKTDISGLQLSNNGITGAIEIVDLTGKRVMDTTPHSFTQLMSKVGIPAQYAKKCPVELLQPHFDYWKEQYMNEGGNSEVLIRARTEGDNQVARAFLSSKYGIMDNKDVVPAFNEAIAGTSYLIDDYSFSEDMFNARLLLDKIYLDAGQTPDGKPNIFFAGLHCANGETGNFNARLELIVHDQWCRNGCFRPIGGKPLFNKRHLGDPADLMAEFKAATQIALAEGGRQVQLFADSRNEILVNPTGILINLIEKKNNNFTEGIRNKIMEKYAMNPDTSKYGIISAITAAAQAYPYETRLDMERFAGTILELKLAA